MCGKFKSVLCVGAKVIFCIFFPAGGPFLCCIRRYLRDVRY